MLILYQIYFSLKTPRINLQSNAPALSCAPGIDKSEGLFRHQSRSLALSLQRLRYQRFWCEIWNLCAHMKL